jgi:L-fuculose-phosphate aldolase
MLLGPERRLVVRYAKRLRPDGLVVLTAGNLSVRSGDLVAITPGSFDYDELTPERICVIGLDGSVAEAPLAPSSEVPMHLGVYDAVPEACAVVHTHAPFASALSTVVDELPALHYLIAELGGPVRVAPYATFGSNELAENVARALEGRTAALLGNHGTIAFGETLEQAYSRTLLLEWLSALYLRSSLLGAPRLLAGEEIELVARKLSRKGAPAGSSPPSGSAPRARAPGRARPRARAAAPRRRESPR